MKNKIILCFLILIVGLTTFLNINVANAEEDTSSNTTLINKLYLENCEFYEDLTNISFFDISNKYIVFTCGDNKIQILNRRNKEKNILTGFVNIEYLKLNDSLLFISNNKNLEIYSLETFSKYSLKNDINNAFSIDSFDKISITNTTINNKPQIFVSTLSTISEIQNINYYYLSIVSNEIQVVRYGNLNKNNNYFLSEKELIHLTNSYENKIYVVCIDKGQYDLLTISLTNEISITKSDFYPNSVTNLNIAQCNLKDYILAISNSEICIVKTDAVNNEATEYWKTWKKGNESLKYNGGFECGTINSPTDIKVFNNKIYVSDNVTKSIQCLSLNITTIENEETNAELTGEKTIVASKCSDAGRFNKNSSLFVNQNDKIFVSDPLNNRIQTINGINASVTIKEAENANHPVQFSPSILYYDIKTSSTTSSIVKYNANETAINKYSYIQNLPTILSMVKKDNLLYILTTNNIQICSGTNTTNLLTSNQDLDLQNDTNAKMILLNKSNSLLLYSNSKFHLLNEDGAIIFSSGLYENITSICSDINDNIFALCDNKILKITIQNQSFVELSTLVNSHFNLYTNISINPKSGIIYAFNNYNCCIETIANTTFNYIENSCGIKTANIKTYVFSKPCGLNSTNVPILEALEIDSHKTIYSTFPIYVDGNSFYMVCLENGYGYINSSDVFFNDEDVVNLKESNAKTYSYNNSEIKVYKYNSINENDVKTILPSGYRICVEDYDEKSLLTKITYYDDKQIENVGYIETKFVKLNGVSYNEYIAIMLCTICVICGILLLVFYLKSKNPHKE